MLTIFILIPTLHSHTPEEWLLQGCYDGGGNWPNNNYKEKSFPLIATKNEKNERMVGKMQNPCSRSEKLFHKSQEWN